MTLEKSMEEANRIEEQTLADNEHSGNHVYQFYSFIHYDAATSVANFKVGGMCFVTIVLGKLCGK